METSSVRAVAPRRFVGFWFSWAIDVVVALVFLYFFFVGLQDGSVSSFNIVLWIAILFLLAVIVGGSLALKVSGRVGLGTLIVTLMAVPSLLIGLMFLALLFIPAH
jgi:hypothetical protein